LWSWYVNRGLKNKKEIGRVDEGKKRMEKSIKNVGAELFMLSEQEINSDSFRTAYFRVFRIVVNKPYLCTTIILQDIT
jgi:hypothetical protein